MVWCVKACVYVCMCVCVCMYACVRDNACARAYYVRCCVEGKQGSEEGRHHEAGPGAEGVNWNNIQKG